MIFIFTHCVTKIQIHRIYPTKTTPIFFPYFSFFFSPFRWEVNPQIYLSQKFSQSSLLAVSDADCPSLLLSPRPFSLSLESKLKEKITVSRIKLKKKEKKKEKLCRLIISHPSSPAVFERVVTRRIVSFLCGRPLYKSLSPIPSLLSRCRPFSSFCICLPDKVIILIYRFSLLFFFSFLLGFL